MLRLLAELARAGTSSAAPAVTNNDVDSWRRRISQKVADVQGLIESSKFELGAVDLDALQKHAGDAQIVFVLLLSLARQKHDVTQPYVVRIAAVELDSVIATALENLATRAARGSRPEVPNLEAMMDAFERSVAAGTNAPRETADSLLTERLAVYRILVAAIKRLSSEPLNADPDGHEVRVLAVQ
jgi:hypothetical protein